MPKITLRPPAAGLLFAARRLLAFDITILMGLYG